MPDDHSELVPLLPIPNRTVKRLCADDSADTRVKVGHCQAIQPGNAPSLDGAFLFVSKAGGSCFTALGAVTSGPLFLNGLYPRTVGFWQRRRARLELS